MVVSGIKSWCLGVVFLRDFFGVQMWDTGYTWIGFLALNIEICRRTFLSGLQFAEHCALHVCAT